MMLVIDFIVFVTSVWVIYFFVTCIHEMGHYLLGLLHRISYWNTGDMLSKTVWRNAI